MKLVFVLRAEDAPAGEPLRLPEHTSVLDDALSRTRARLLVIDPIVAFLDPRIQSSNDASVTLDASNKLFSKYRSMPPRWNNSP